MRYQLVRQTTRTLAEPLSEEDCALQSMPDASPVKWHLAHTSWFFETFVLAPHDPGYQIFDPAYRVLFNSYYNAVGDKHPRPERGLLSRPSLEDVKAYRAHVDAAMLNILRAGVTDSALHALVELGLQHEQQHQELILTDVKHLLSLNPLRPVYHASWPLTPVQGSDAAWQGFDGGLCQIGHGGAGFAFDNEGPRHKVWLAPFELATRPVTHGEFQQFVEDGGYQRPELWLAAGWDHRCAEHWEAPAYWHRLDGRWHSFTLHGLVPLDPHTPICHLSFYEADAYARWVGARLPTEAEWEIAAQCAGGPENFLESAALHPMPAQVPPEPGTLGQMFGDVWEWTRSDYAPYPGYQPWSGAVGEYNGKFMSGQYVLRGGSCATPGSHIRVTYRNFFPPQARWQFSGLRLARDASHGSEG